MNRLERLKARYTGQDYQRPVETGGPPLHHILCLGGPLHLQSIRIPEDAEMLNDPTRNDCLEISFVRKGMPYQVVASPAGSAIVSDDIRMRALMYASRWKWSRYFGGGIEPSHSDAENEAAIQAALTEIPPSITYDQFEASLNITRPEYLKAVNELRRILARTGVGFVLDNRLNLSIPNAMDRMVFVVDCHDVSRCWPSLT